MKDVGPILDLYFEDFKFLFIYRIRQIIIKMTMMTCSFVLQVIKLDNFLYLSDDVDKYSK